MRGFPDRGGVQPRRLGIELVLRQKSDYRHPRAEAKLGISNQIGDIMHERST